MSRAGEMNGNDQPHLRPKVRFPEFKEDGAWHTETIGEISEPIKEKVGEHKITPVSITAGVGFVPQADKFGRDISGEQYKNYTYLRRGDFAYNKGNSKSFPQGYVCQLHEFDEVAASSAFICFKLNDGYEPAFLKGLFDRNTHGRQLAAHITSGARSNGLLNLNAGQFYGVQLPFPPNFEEQQRIAECLASIDTLIEAETEKLDALKDHKQGLMQQLFPAEGESLPALRFPEFRSEPAWTEKAVSEVFEVTRGRVLAMTLVSEAKTDQMRYPVYSSQTKRRGLCGYYSEYLYQDAITWTTDGAGAGDVNFRSGQFFCTNVCGVLLSKEGFANPFMAALLNRRTRSHVSYHGNPKLMNGVMGDIVIPVPSLPEQQYISSLLVEMDSYIEHQEAKIDQLSQHKQGLLQQLFPVLDEVDG